MTVAEAVLLLHEDERRNSQSQGENVYETRFLSVPGTSLCQPLRPAPKSSGLISASVDGQKYYNYYLAKLIQLTSQINSFKYLLKYAL